MLLADAVEVPADAEPDSTERDAAGHDAADLARLLDEAREQCDALREQLIETQRLAALGSVAAVVAHEFNNCLTPIGAYAKLALADLDAGREDPAIVRKALERARSGAGKAERIARSVTGLARGESDGLGVVALAEVLAEVEQVVGRDLAAARVTLRANVPGDLRIAGDAVQLEQVLLNLVLNARHAMTGRGGTLTVAATAAAGRASVTVADTGPGIAPEHVARVFDPFFTTKPAAGEGRGSGLGLAVCRQIVEKHRGTIAVASAPGRGTTFTLDLPLAA